MISVIPTSKTKCHYVTQLLCIQIQLGLPLAINIKSGIIIQIQYSDTEKEFLLYCVRWWSVNFVQFIIHILYFCYYFWQKIDGVFPVLLCIETRTWNVRQCTLRHFSMPSAHLYRPEIMWQIKNCPCKLIFTTECNFWIFPAMHTEIHNNAAQCVTVRSTCSQQATLTFKLPALPFYETHTYKFPFVYPKIFTSAQMLISSNIKLNTKAIRVGTWTIQRFPFPILHNTPASIQVDVLLFIPQKLFKKFKFKIIWFCFHVFPFSLNVSGLLWLHITSLTISYFQTHYHATLRNVIFHQKNVQNNTSLNHISFTAPPPTFSVRTSRGTHLETYSPGNTY